MGSRADAEKGAGVGADDLHSPLLVLDQNGLASVKGIKIRLKLKAVPGQFSGLPTDGNDSLENSGSLTKKPNTPNTVTFPNLSKPITGVFKDWK